MRKTIIIVILLMCGTMVFGQAQIDNNVEEYREKGPQTVESTATNPKNPTWYMVQMEAWQKRIEENPKDEWAWRNLYQATRYYYNMVSVAPDVNREEFIRKVLEEMKQAIPESFTYYLCSLYLNDEQELENLKHAITLMPEDVCGSDVLTLAARAWLYTYEIGETTQQELFQKSFQKQGIPERIIRYSLNMLQSMEPNAVYFGNGDNALLPMKMLQDVYQIRQDVTILPLSFFFLKEHRDYSWKTLNIKHFAGKEDFSDYSQYGQEWSKHFTADIIQHVIKETGRPCYLFPDIINATTLDQTKIYNEGLLLKWSEKPYDNFAVAMKNVTEVYHLEYLTEPELVYSTSATSAVLDGNYVLLLSHLVGKLYDAGHIKESEKLANTLSQCIKSVRMDAKGRENLEKALAPYLKDKK